MTIYDTREGARLARNGERPKDWTRWGPYLAERAWGTVREDYSAGGDAWVKDAFHACVVGGHQTGWTGLIAEVLFNLHEEPAAGARRPATEKRV